MKKWRSSKNIKHCKTFNVGTGYSWLIVIVAISFVWNNFGITFDLCLEFNLFIKNNQLNFELLKQSKNIGVVLQISPINESVKGLLS